MIGSLIKGIFFGNYFVGLLAVVLSLETVIQLQIPFNSIPYYIVLFCFTVMYYTYAYTGVLHSASITNLRSIWYREHAGFVRASQWCLGIVCGLGSLILFLEYYLNIFHLPIAYWLIVGVIFLASVLYYGLLPKSVFKINLRNTGWLKAFVIGFVWAGSVSLIPLVMLHIEGKVFYADTFLMIVFFIKNWMFCTVNAIMFDLKDYEDDSNKQLKTFVVRFGLHHTISYILVPLIIIGMISALVVTHIRQLGALPITIILIPFILMLMVSYSMYRQKSILYYLIVIDGLVMIKALSGILAMQFIQP